MSAAKAQISRTSTTNIRIGSATESTEITVAATSSAVLTTGSPTPAVVAVMSGRTATDLTVWTVPATNRPHMSERTRLTSVTLPALAAKTIAPAVGRMKV